MLNTKMMVLQRYLNQNDFKFSFDDKALDFYINMYCFQKSKIRL